MDTKTITVSVESETEERFRRLARSLYQGRKGYLGKALTEAMGEWERRRLESDTVARTLALLDKGIKMGKFTFKTREELHER